MFYFFNYGHKNIYLHKNSRFIYHSLIINIVQNSFRYHLSNATLKIYSNLKFLHAIVNYKIELIAIIINILFCLEKSLVIK